MPTSSAKAKSFSVSPPKSSSARIGSSVQNDVASDRVEHLAHRAVDDLRERRPRHARHVLADAVEHDDRVVERVAEDGQQRRDRRRRHLPAGQRVDARRDQQVVHQRDQHRHRVLPLESQRDVGADDDQRRDDRDDRALRDRVAERRPDRLSMLKLRVAELLVAAPCSTLWPLSRRQRLGRDLEAVAARAPCPLSCWILASPKPERRAATSRTPSSFAGLHERRLDARARTRSRCRSSGPCRRSPARRSAGSRPTARRTTSTRP